MTISLPSLSARKNKKREKQLQGGSEAIVRREEGKGGKEKMNRSRKREEKITRAAMIPQSVPAAWKFLKKEVAHQQHQPSCLHLFSCPEQL